MRHLSPDIFKDSFLGELPIEYRMLWIGMIIAIADDQGRMVDDPLEIAKEIFRYDHWMQKDVIERGLALFAKHKKIIRYAAGTNGNGRKLIQIVKWWEYQTGQWAARSKHAAPPKWVDRIRAHEPGEGQTPVKVNWDQPGGFRKTVKRLYSANTAALQRQESREDEDEDKDNGRRRGKDKYPPPLPPSSQQAAGGGDTQEKMIDLKPRERARAEKVKPILHAALFRDSSKVITLSALVATRSSRGDDIAYVVGAFASAYADPKAENKNAIAAYRIEHDQVDAQWLDPKAWTEVPAVILKAAGIRDLRAYVVKHNLEKYLQ